MTLPEMATAAGQFALTVYASCYSTVADDMGQWRSYADGGRGVALAFDMKSMEQACKGAILGRVVYEPEQQRRMAERVVGNEVKAVLADAGSAEPAKGLPKELPPDFWPLLRAHMLGLIPLMELASRFKHRSFAHESEWRLREFHRADFVEPSGPLAPFYLSGYRHPAVGFRAHEGLLVPYVQHGTGGGPLPLAAVIVGPRGHQPLQSGAFRLALDASGYASTALSSSELPMR